MKKLIKVTINDFRLVFRDISLRFFFIFPILNLFVVRYGLPFVVGHFVGLENYVVIVMMFMANQGALIFGFIYSLVLIDEKDTNVAKVYGVLPVSKFWFVLFRIIPAFLFASISTILLLFAQTYYPLSFTIVVIYSGLVGLIAPMMALFVAIMSKNKLEGMTWQKLFNLPVALPVLAFFVPVSFSALFGILPTYWAYQGFYNLINGAGFSFQFIIGYGFNLLIVVVMAKRFSRTHFQ
jgi:fluoroquinolone transport system permease protein